jgi:hypothetical protein
MSYRRDLKLLRHARKQVKRQLRQLAELELSGLTAVTLHTHSRQLTISLASATGAPFTDGLREALRERRQILQAETQHLLITWLADEQLHSSSAPDAGTPQP